MAASAVLGALLGAGFLAMCTGQGIFNRGYSSNTDFWSGETTFQGGKGSALRLLRCSVGLALAHGKILTFSLTTLGRGTAACALIQALFYCFACNKAILREV